MISGNYHVELIGKEIEFPSLTLCNKIYDDKLLYIITDFAAIRKDAGICSWAIISFVVVVYVKPCFRTNRIKKLVSYFFLYFLFSRRVKVVRQNSK